MGMYFVGILYSKAFDFIDNRFIYLKGLRQPLDKLTPFSNSKMSRTLKFKNKL